MKVSDNFFPDHFDWHSFLGPPLLYGFTYTKNSCLEKKLFEINVIIVDAAVNSISVSERNSRDVYLSHYVHLLQPISFILNKNVNLIEKLPGTKYARVYFCRNVTNINFSSPKIINFTVDSASHYSCVFFRCVVHVICKKKKPGKKPTR